MHIMHPRAESAAPSSLALPTIHQPPPNLTCCRRTANLAGLHPPRSKSREPLQNAVSPLQCALHSLQAELDRRGLAHTVIMEDGPRSRGAVLRAKPDAALKLLTQPLRPYVRVTPVNPSQRQQRQHVAAGSAGAAAQEPTPAAPGESQQQQQQRKTTVSSQRASHHHC